MRILALISLVIALSCVFGVTTTALGQEDVSSAPTPRFAEDVPPLLPMTTAKPAATAGPVSGGGIPEPVLIATAYWLVIGSVALRRARRLEATPA